MPKYKPGDTLKPFVLRDIYKQEITVPVQKKLTHIQFRRFAGCPMCNLHLQSFLRRSAELEQAEINEVIFFYSKQEKLLEYNPQGPFSNVADPNKKYYRAFGVESSIFSVLNPKIVIPALKGTLQGHAGLPGQGETPLGLPADFLIDEQGVILACQYGQHAYDHWPLEHVLALAQKTNCVQLSSNTMRIEH